MLLSNLRSKVSEARVACEKFNFNYNCFVQNDNNTTVNIKYNNL